MKGENCGFSLSCGQFVINLQENRVSTLCLTQTIQIRSCVQEHNDNRSHEKQNAEN
jgi:hypothetical protein